MHKIDMNSTTEMEDDDKFNETDFFNIYANTTITEISKILTTSDNESAKPLWFQIMDILALFILTCGFVANLGTIYILSGGGKLFTPAVRILLRHQAGIDAFCSVCDYTYCSATILVNRWATHSFVLIFKSLRSFFCGGCYLCFGLLVTFVLGFNAKVRLLLVCFVACMILRFKSGVTPPDPKTTSILVEPFLIHIPERFSFWSWNLDDRFRQPTKLKLCWSYF